MLGNALLQSVLVCLQGVTWAVSGCQEWLHVYHPAWSHQTGASTSPQLLLKQVRCSEQDGGKNNMQKITSAWWSKVFVPNEVMISTYCWLVLEAGMFCCCPSLFCWQSCEWIDTSFSHAFKLYLLTFSSTVRRSLKQLVVMPISEVITFLWEAILPLLSY